MCFLLFLVSVMQNGLCCLNCINCGFLVNDDFEVSLGFCVIGFLVGGNFIFKICFWYVESVLCVWLLVKLLVVSLFVLFQFVVLVLC